MKLVIYEMAHSPYCIPITQALTAFGVPFDRVAVPNWDRSEVIKLTDGAYYQVPILVHGDQVIYESSDWSLDVARYVDQNFTNNKLFPVETNGLQEIIVKHIEDEVEGLTFKLCDINYLPAIDDPVARTMTIRHKERKFGRGCVDQWREQADALRDELNRLLERFDTTLQHRPFLMDEQPQYVDFALFGVIENYTFQDYNQLDDSHQALARWRAQLEAFRFE